MAGAGFVGNKVVWHVRRDLHAIQINAIRK